MGRYLDLLRGRDDQAGAEIRDCEKSEKSEKSPPHPPLISLNSLFSQSRTCDLDQPPEPQLGGPPPAPTETTEVGVRSTPESSTPDYTPTEGPIISPARWAGAASDGPPFEEPGLERRGLVERQGSVFLHFCVECGRWGAYGYGTTLSRPGRWYCRLHRPA
jgi:hypothetical protein